MIAFSYLAVSLANPNVLLLWSGDPHGYMKVQMAMDITNEERSLDAGRFALMANQTCKYDVTYQHELTFNTICGMIQPIVEWCHEHCTDRWYIDVIANHDTRYGNLLLVSFDNKDNAELYAVMLKLDCNLFKDHDL